MFSWFEWVGPTRRAHGQARQQAYGQEAMQCLYGHTAGLFVGLGYALWLRASRFNVKKFSSWIV